MTGLDATSALFFAIFMIVFYRFLTSILSN